MCLIKLLLVANFLRQDMPCFSVRISIGGSLSTNSNEGGFTCDGTADWKDGTDGVGSTGIIGCTCVMADSWLFPLFGMFSEASVCSHTSSRDISGSTGLLCSRETLFNCSTVLLGIWVPI